MTDPTPVDGGFDFGVTDVPTMPERTPDHKAGSERVNPFSRPSTKDRRGAERKRAPKAPLKPYTEGMYVKQIEEAYLGIGMLIMPFKPKVAMYLTMPSMEIVDGETTQGATGARKCAEAWDAAASKSEALRRVIESVFVVTVWGAVLMAHMPIVFMWMEDRGPSTENGHKAPHEMMADMFKQYAPDEDNRDN